MPRIYDFSATLLNGTVKPLSAFRGQVMLIVNVASQCGFTPQYAELEELWRTHKDHGLAVLGFPCNQFGGQEPGTSIDIAEFCTLNYDVTFPLFDKVDVKGPHAHPLFRFLTSEKRGLLGSSSIKWNFTKFLVTRDGNVFSRSAPNRTPASLEDDILMLLKQTPAWEHDDIVDHRSVAS